MAVLDPRREGFGSGSNVVNFTASHDTERELARLGSAGIFDEVAFRRAKHAAALLFTAPGLPMVWMGEEFGEFAPKTLESMALHWELLPGKLNEGLFKYYSSLILLRKNTEALQHGNNIEFFFTDPERKLFAFRRWDERGGNVAVVANLKDEVAGDIQVPNFPADGKWHEWTLDYDVQVEGKILHDNFAESQVKIYIARVAA